MRRPSAVEHDDGLAAADVVVVQLDAAGLDVVSRGGLVQDFGVVVSTMVSFILPGGLTSSDSESHRVSGDLRGRARRRGGRRRTRFCGPRAGGGRPLDLTIYNMEMGYAASMCLGLALALEHGPPRGGDRG